MIATLRKTAEAAATRIFRSSFYYGKYNNTLPFRINNAYTSHARACAAAYAAAHPGETLPESPVWKNAAVRVKNAFPRAKAEAYSQKITDMIANSDPAVDVPKNFADLQTRIREPLHSLGADLVDVFRSPEADAQLRAFFKGYYRIQWMTVYRTVPAQRKVSSWMWHSDSYPPRTVKLFLHLTPANAEVGATEFMNWDDTMAYRRAGYFGQYLGERYGDLEEFAKAHNLPYRPFHYDAEPGDATIFDMNFFHRAVSPKRDFRDVVQFYLLPNAIPWDEQLNKDGIYSVESYSSYGYPKDPRNLTLGMGKGMH